MQEFKIGDILYANILRNYKGTLFFATGCEYFVNQHVKNRSISKISETLSYQFLY